MRLAERPFQFVQLRWGEPSAVPLGFDGGQRRGWRTEYFGRAERQLSVIVRRRWRRRRGRWRVPIIAIDGRQ